MSNVQRGIVEGEMGGFPVPGMWPGGWRPRWWRRREGRRDSQGGQTPVLNLVVLRTTDLEKIQWFYEALGLHFVEEQHGGGHRHLAARLPSGLVLELYPTGAEPGQEGGEVPRLGFGVADVRSAVTAAAEAGGSVLAEPHGAAGQMQAVLADPDGHRVELTEAPA